MSVHYLQLLQLVEMLERPVLDVGDHVTVEVQLLQLTQLREGHATDGHQAVIGQISAENQTKKLLLHFFILQTILTIFAIVFC